MKSTNSHKSSHTSVQKSAKPSPEARSTATLISRTAAFAREHRFAESLRCPVCWVGRLKHCKPLEGGQIRRRGRRWHHQERFALATRDSPARVAQRVERAAVLLAAPTTPQKPKPGPTPTPYVGSMPLKVTASSPGAVESSTHTGLAKAEFGTSAGILDDGAHLNTDAVSNRLDHIRSRENK